MHQFLSSVGFSEYRKKEQIDMLIQDVIQRPSNRVTMKADNGTEYVELSKDYGEFMGIAVRGEYDSAGEFMPEYYFPYFCGSGITTTEHVDIERHSDKDSFAGICDETRVGVTLIFYLQNALEYFKEYYQGKLHGNMQTSLTGLSSHGTIILPVNMEDAKDKTGKNRGKDRLSLIEAAREGDEEAIESLTIEDIDTYSMISRRIAYEDILTIVSTYFMPYGIESDHYAILGNIVDYHYTKNAFTNEDICIMTLDCNNMVFDICVNTKDLVGQPDIGRRYKGIIWMQGAVYHK